MRFFLTCMLLSLLVACGGGGGGSAGNGGNTATYTITVAATTNGTVTPSRQTVQANQSATLTVTPASGYVLDSISGCGGQLTGNSFQN